MAIITMSRGTFSGGQALAECVSEKLGYRCLAMLALEEAAGKRYGVSEEKLSKAMNEAPGVLERLGLERVHHLAVMRAALVREVRDDNVVYHGLGGHLLLTGIPHVLRVRVIANMEFRIKGAMDRGHLMRQDAVHSIRTMDDRRARWTKFLYHVDWGDPSSYDLVINLDHLSLPSACEVICHTVSLDEFKATPQSRKIMDDLVLGTEVRAQIAADAASKKISDAGIEIQADNGAVVIGGTVGSLEDADKIRDIVRKVPGVTSINSRMKVSSSW